MKTLVLTLMGLLVLLTGCVGPYYGKQGQYDRGNWYFLANNREVHQRELQQLAFQKLKDQPVRVGVSTNGVLQGFYGVIDNPYYRTLEFKYWGPEHGSETLAPGQRVYKFLLPGKYTGRIYDGGRLVGWAEFASEVQEKGYLGEKVHWKFYSKPRW